MGTNLIYVGVLCVGTSALAQAEQTANQAIALENDLVRMKVSAGGVMREFVCKETGKNYVPDDRLAYVPCPTLAQAADAQAKVITLAAPPDLPPTSPDAAFSGHVVRVGDELIRSAFALCRAKHAALR